MRGEYTNVTRQHRVGAENNKVGKFEKATWPWLRDLAENCPEAGIHFLRKQKRPQCRRARTDQQQLRWCTIESRTENRRRDNGSPSC